MKNQPPSTMTNVLYEVRFHRRAGPSGRDVLNQATVVRQGYAAVGLMVTDSALQLIVDGLEVCLEIFLFPT